MGKSNFNGSISAKFFTKTTQKFDQSFLNEEEDKPLDNRRFTSVPKLTNKQGTLVMDFVYKQRDPCMAKQVVIKPVDFTVRAYS
jgi:hypothetical protein